jgi:superfamily II DNA or RNA helicase
MPSLPSSKAQQALIKRALPAIQKYNPRKGQLALIECLAIDPKTKSAKFIVPTGYGKTDAIELSYKLLKLQDRVDALFIIVPSKEQLSSYLGGIEADFRSKWGDEIVAYRLSSNFLKIVTRDVLSNKCEVIVATCQSLMSANNLDVAKRLLSESGKRWMVALDELHRYGEENQWGLSVGTLLEQNPEFVLGLTAAKDRTDGMPVAMENPDIIVEVTPADAISEKAIRPFRTHVHDYSVTVEFNGEMYDMTTKELSELEGEYIDARKAQGVPKNRARNEAREFLAYKDKYISTLVQSAVDCLNSKREKLDVNDLPSTKHHRMLVFARDQKHAEHLQNYFVRYGDLRADWLGEKRPDEINEQVLKDFLSGTLDVMINVNKASEGFNCVQCSVMLFLNDVKPSVMILQQLGRGLRRNYSLEYAEDWCDVFISEDHPSKKYFLDMEDLQPDEYRKPLGESRDSTAIYAIPAIMFGDVELQTIRIVNGFMKKAKEDNLLDAIKDVAISRGHNAEAELMAEAMMRKIMIELHSQAAQKQVLDAYGSTDRIEQARSSNAKAVKMLAGNIVRSLSLGNFNKSRLPDANKAINTLLKRKFGAGTDSMSESELVRRHAFINEINEKLRSCSREQFAQEFPTLCIA